MSEEQIIPDAQVVSIRRADVSELPDALAQLTGGSKPIRYMSFDPKTPIGRSILDRCSVASDARVKAQVNLPLKVQDVFMHRITLTHPETGEVFETTRTCLIAPDGQVYACCSRGIVEAVIRLVEGHGLPPWQGGVPVKVLLQDRPNGRQWLTLVNDEPANQMPKRERRS